jgi:fused
MLNLTSKTDLSPKGLISLVTLFHDTISTLENKSFLQKVFKNCLKLLCSLLRDNQLLSVQEWPSYCGGGNPAACMITTHVLRIFNLPFNIAGFEKEIEQIAGEMAKADIVHLTLNALRYLTNENIPIAFSLISKLVYTAECSKNFAN